MKAILETFKPVVGYKGLYEISDCGAVRSLKYGKVRYLKNMKRPTGYEQIDLRRDGKRKTFSVHRLVWEAFVGPIPEGMEIDHINTVRDDNRLANLRVVTPKGNMANQITAARHQEATREANRRKSKDPKWIEAHREGTRKTCAKPVLQIDKETGEVIREWECQRDIERELGINQSSISECCNGNRKSAGGFKWKLV